MIRMKRKQRRDRILVLNEEIRDLAKKAQDEKRALTDEERSAIAAKKAERDNLVVEDELEEQERMRSRLAVVETVKGKELARAFAEKVMNAISARDGVQISIEIPEERAVQDTASAQELVPLTIGEVIEPLEKGLILDKVGVKMQYGLEGEWQYPVVSAIEATIEDENAEVGDTTIDISAIKPTPRRVSIAVPVSNRALYMTNDKLREIVMRQITLASVRTLNKWMFSNTAIKTGVEGPFVTPKTSKEYETAPSYKDLIDLQGAVDTTGIVPDGTVAYVMNNAMRAALRTTPRDAGSGRMVIENDNIDGVPVFVTEYCPADTVYFGYFGYCMVGQFGPMNLIIDPYTAAKKNITYFILNTDYDIKPARTEAFGVLKKKMGQ